MPRPKRIFDSDRRDLDGAVDLVEQLAQLRDAFARDDHARHALRAVGPRHRDPRQPVAVGRRRLQHRLRLVGDVQVDAVQIVTRLLGRDGEAGLVDDLAQGRGRQLEAGRQLALGDHREIVARQRRQGEAGAAGIDLHPPLGGDQLDLAALGQLADDVEQGVGRDRGRAGIGDIGFDRLVDLEVEIGRHQPDAALLPASIRTFDRIGIVFRRSTTLWTWPRPLRSVARSIVAFIDYPCLRAYFVGSEKEL